jgi:putative zinc finger protein
VNPCLSDDILCAYLDGAIAPKDAIWVSEHMAECATCAVRLKELGQMVKLMGAALDAELSKDAPTERLRAQFKAFLNEASAPFSPAKTVSPSLSNFVSGSAPRLLEWLSGSFRRLAFASVIGVSIAIVVALAMAAWRSGSLKTGSGEKTTQAVNSTDSTNSQTQTPDQARGKPVIGEQATANNHQEHTASARADRARPTHVNPENRALKARPKESPLPSGKPGEPPYVATGDRNEPRVLDGEKTRPFKGLAHSFASDANPITKPETELQRPNSAQGQNPTVVLPAGMGAFPIVGLSPEANSWAVQIITRGGFAGKGKGDLTITSQGRLVWNEIKNQCNVKLRDDVLQMLTQTAFSADASKWVGYPSRICDDCYVTAIVLQRREGDGIGRTYIAYWDDATAGKISEGLRKVYDTFMTHKECKQ